jgi:uncharacterized protein (TIGR02284 family)
LLFSSLRIEIKRIACIFRLQRGVFIMATVTQLPEKSIDWLQSLIQTNLDSMKGFAEAAENLQGRGSSLEALFCNLSRERSEQAAELQALVGANREDPEAHSSMTAAAHRAWMDLRTALGGGDKAVLEEAERGEDYIKDRYEEALQDLGNCPCTQVLRHQYAAVKASHDKVKELRDRHPG